MLVLIHFSFCFLTFSICINQSNTNKLSFLIYRKLNRAVNCFKNYRSMCINDNIHNSKIITDFYDQMSEGPLGLTMELCNNTKFKQGNVDFLCILKQNK